jgi:hypothetical protein
MRRNTSFVDIAGVCESYLIYEDNYNYASEGVTEFLEKAWQRIKDFFVSIKNAIVRLKDKIVQAYKNRKLPKEDKIVNRAVYKYVASVKKVANSAYKLAVDIAQAKTTTKYTSKVEKITSYDEMIKSLDELYEQAKSGGTNVFGESTSKQFISALDYLENLLGGLEQNIHRTLQTASRTANGKGEEIPDVNKVANDLIQISQKLGRHITNALTLLNANIGSGGNVTGEEKDTPDTSTDQ